MKSKKFSDLTQYDLDRIDEARKNAAYKAALTRRLESDRAKADANNDWTRAVVLGELADRDLYSRTRSYQTAYRQEKLRLYRQIPIAS